MIHDQPIDPEILARVRRGAKLLDYVAPGWAEAMRPGLELSSCTECVLGQLYGDYAAGFKALVDSFTGPYQLFRATEHGFTATMRIMEDDEGNHTYQNTDEFEALTIAWQREIAARGGNAI